MRDFDSGVGDRLGEIRHRRIMLQFSDNPFAGQELQELDYEETHLITVHKWFNDIVSAVLNNATSKETRKQEGWHEVISYITPLDVFDKYRRLGGNRLWRLRSWINDLVKDGMIDSVFAKTLDLKEPVDELQKEKEEQRRKFSEHKDAMKELVREHSKKTGNTRWKQEFNATFSILFQSGGFEPDDRWLDLFKRHLVDRGLLPTGFDRAMVNVQGAVKKVKAVLA